MPSFKCNEKNGMIHVKCLRCKRITPLKSVRGTINQANDKIIIEGIDCYPFLLGGDLYEKQHVIHFKFESDKMNYYKKSIISDGSEIESKSKSKKGILCSLLIKKNK
jgi:hypothetical protein